MGVLRPLAAFLMALQLISVGAGAATVVIDAGHGGHDPGGIAGQLYVEKKAALDVAKRIQERLKKSGHRVIMTRDGDYFVELSRRVSISNKAPGRAVFVSVHFNASPNTEAKGIETYYYSSGSSQLAYAVHSRMVAAAKTEDRGVRRARFFVLRYNRRPSILVELGFLTNREEGGRIYKDRNYRQALAHAVADGIHSQLR